MPVEGVVVVFSGGMDSTVLLYKLIEDGYRVSCLTFYYGQRHVIELEAAKAVVKELAIDDHRVIDIRGLGQIAVGALADPECSVPEGHYTDPKMRATIVPNRNPIMLAFGASYAIKIGAQWVAFAAHAGDAAIYPDCRPEFVEAMQAMLRLSHEGGPGILAPFLDLDKVEICRLGVKLGVPFELTWTCYNGERPPCGKCGACVERAEAFAEVGIEDPTMR